MRRRPPASGGPLGDPARLQPARAVARRITPLTGDALVELTLAEFDTDEHDEAHQAAEQLTRHWEDLARYEDLAAQGFAGVGYELFTADLAAYGYPVIRSMLRRGVVFQYCADRGRPVRVTARDREHLTTPGSDSEAGDDRTELSLETNARALEFFRKYVLLPGAWSVEGGASLNTFYVGACLFAFPNVFQRWAGERRRTVPVLPQGEADESSSAAWSATGTNLDLDPATTVVSALTVAHELDAMPARTRAVAERVVFDGAPFAEIAAQLGMTERAVEGLLYRYRVDAQRRQLRRRLA